MLPVTPGTSPGRTSRTSRRGDATRPPQRVKFAIFSFALSAVTASSLAVGLTTLTRPATERSQVAAASPAASPQRPDSTQQPVTLGQPVTGPRPPLPMEKGGPYGSRRTTGSANVALTFDDGPDPRYTPQALALLRSYHVKATFCLVGQNAHAFPQLVRQIVAEGHTLCNHSWRHDMRLGSRSVSAIRTDLVATDNAIRAAVPGATISYYRQPGGFWTRNVVAVARELGMTPLGWAVDPRDWRRPGAGIIAGRVKAQTVRGSIVLLHDAGGDRSQTMAALGSILPNLTRRFALAALPLGVGSPRLNPPGVDRTPQYGVDMPLHPGQE